MRFDDVEVIRENSYKNFHAKGFDYLCLARTPALTVKAYFFDGRAEESPEVVSPHNHRYDFTTTVLTGSVADIKYERITFANNADQVYVEQEYMTPLNGGFGFKPKGFVFLKQFIPDIYGQGESHFSRYTDIHTIEIYDPETILILCQYEDKLDLDEPTTCFTKQQEVSIAGLYDRMSNQDVIDRLTLLKKFGF